MAQLSHATRYGHLGAALALLSTLCGLAESAPGLVELVMVWAAPACILALSISDSFLNVLLFGMLCGLAESAPDSSALMTVRPARLRVGDLSGREAPAWSCQQSWCLCSLIYISVSL